MNYLLQQFFVIIISLILGGIIAYWFYFKSGKQQFNKKTKIILFLLRTLSISALIFLLFNPKIIYTSKHNEKPSLLIAIDNTQSIKYLSDSLMLDNSMIELDNQIVELQKYYNVEKITFGSTICDTCKIDFSESETNISAIFDYINLNMQINPPKGLIILSDGIYNAGSPPLARNEINSLPIFSVIMGDTTQYPDYWISNVRVNPIAFVNSNFPVEIDIARTTIDLNNLTVIIYNKGKEVKRQTVTFGENERHIRVDMSIAAKNMGIFQYDVHIEPNLTEQNKDNNQTTFVIEVIESDKKALLLYKAPTPDIAVIKRSFSLSPAYQLEVIQSDDFSGDFESYDFVIFVQLPMGDFKTDNYVVEYMRKKRPVWFITGTHTDMSMLNHMNLGWYFNKTSSKLDLAYPVINPSFSYFKFLPEFEQIVDKLPPLYCPFGIWTINNNVEIALKQRIGSIETNNPLLLTTFNGTQRVALLVGEGIWRWNMYLNRVLGTSGSMNDLVLQIAQFLSTQPMTEPFKLNVNQIWQKNSNINIEAYAYNINYQLVNNHSVELVITNQNGEKNNFTMQPFEQYYKAQIGSLPVGVYSVSGFYNTDSIVYTDKKSFIVSDMNIEKLASTPHVELMEALSGYRSDRILFQNDMQSLAQNIVKQIDDKPVVMTTSIASDVILFLSVLFFIVFCATFEWFLRKYYGQL